MNKLKMKAGMRNVFTAPPGYNLVVCDYSSQETRVAACLSQDREMLKVYFTERDNPTLIRPDTGEEYENPNCDLHCVAALSIYPELQQVDLWNLMHEAKRELPDGTKRRQIGKILNFSLIYGAQAPRIAEAAGTSPEEAQKILNDYFKKFYGLQRWLNKMGTIGRYQKWVEDALGRKYFIAESNSKGKDDDNTAVRKATNTLVQGLSASMSKKAGYYTVQAFDKLNDYYRTRIIGFKEAELVALVH